MIDCDDTNWPLAITVAEKAVTLADHRLFLGTWSRWLDRARPFVLLRIFACEAAMVEPAGALSESRGWLTANADRVGALVLGIATAMPRNHLGRAERPDASGLLGIPAFGVPAQVFADGLSAVTWLQEEILARAGMAIEGL
jgi:hypothetical protein